MPLLTGCWALSIEPQASDEQIEQKSKIESLYGATREDIIKTLGEPKWIEVRDDSTFFIYEWRQTDKFINFLAVFPVMAGRFRVRWDCLLLEFDDGKHLIHHETATDSYDYVAPWGSTRDNLAIKRINCLTIFNKPTELLKAEIRAYCPNAELGFAFAQKRIADIYYSGLYKVERDLTRAYVWYSLASADDGIDISHRLNVVVNQMSPKEFAEAQRLLERWEPGHCKIDLLKRHRATIKME
ncbi:MAG: hypothetical protein ACK2T3_13495 [Candidatus Promineifilaceae bacterium]